MFRLIFIFVNISLLTLTTHCQSDTSAVEPVPKPISEPVSESVPEPSLEVNSEPEAELEDEPEPEPKFFQAFNPKPALVLGVGSLTFYGDTGLGLRSNNPFTASRALSVGVNLPLRRNIDFSLSALFSTLTLNEPGFDMRNNFRSNISGGTALVTYNFDDLLPKGAYLQPYIGTGISSFEFLSKADLYDANGNEYHLWENGVIMNLPEDSPNAHEAIMLQRDYVYESDLREMNGDGETRYQDRTLSIPLSLGVNFNISKHLKGQLGTTMFFNFNDMIDDVGNDANGSDGRKDRFLHSSLSISYDLSIPKKKKEHFELDLENEAPELMTEDYLDSDNDGVIDFDDECLGHPVGVMVDEKGCPVDTDKDGVADYKDDEPETLADALVNEFGVTIDDETYLAQYSYWIDSLGVTEWDELYSKVESNKPAETFSVLILPDREGLNQDDINSLLAEDDVRATDEEGEQGYLIGNFESLPDAVNKKLSLQGAGFVGSVQKEKEGEDRKNIDDELGGMTQVVEERNKIVSVEEPSQEAFYRIQVGAFKYILSDNIFADIDDIMVLQGEDGLYRYMTETYYLDSKSAAERRVQLLTEGFEGAFITAYKKGTRITLADAGLKVAEGYEDLTVDKENNSITKSRVTFQIQLGEYVDEIPTEKLEKFLEMGKVKPIKEEVVTRYMLGSFANYAEAKVFLESLKEQGIEDAEVKGVFEERVITLEEALNITGEKGQSFTE